LDKENLNQNFPKIVKKFSN